MICLPKDCLTIGFLVTFLSLIVNCGIKWPAFVFLCVLLGTEEWKNSYSGICNKLLPVLCMLLHKDCMNYATHGSLIQNAFLIS